MIGLISLIIFVIGFIFVWIRSDRDFWTLVIYVIVFFLISGICYSFYDRYKKEKDELEWCREKINNNLCDGWDILITDKYSQKELEGKVLVMKYYVSYRYQMINGSDKKFYSKTESVKKDIYNYYQVGKHYHNNCTFLTKDTGN